MGWEEKVWKYLNARFDFFYQQLCIYILFIAFMLFCCSLTSLCMLLHLII